MPLGSEDHVDQAGAGSDPRAVSGAVDLDTSERGRIDEQGPVRRNARTVAGRLNGDRQPPIGREPHRGHDIVAAPARTTTAGRWRTARFHGEHALSKPSSSGDSTAPRTAARRASKAFVCRTLTPPQPSGHGWR